MKTERILYKATTLNDGYGGERKEIEQVETVEEANLCSSEVQIVGYKKALLFNRDKSLHAPALDIDGIHCELKESSTEGNWHLYIDKPMPWEDYEKLLRVLAEVGIIEQAFYKKSVTDGKSYLRVRNRKYDP